MFYSRKISKELIDRFKSCFCHWLSFKFFCFNYVLLTSLYTFDPVSENLWIGFSRDGKLLTFYRQNPFSYNSISISENFTNMIENYNFQFEWKNCLKRTVSLLLLVLSGYLLNDCHYAHKTTRSFERISFFKAIQDLIGPIALSMNL